MIVDKFIRLSSEQESFLAELEAEKRCKITIEYPIAKKGQGNKNKYNENIEDSLRFWRCRHSHICGLDTPLLDSRILYRNCLIAARYKFYTDFLFFDRKDAILQLCNDFNVENKTVRNAVCYYSANVADPTLDVPQMFPYLNWTTKGWKTPKELTKDMRAYAFKCAIVARVYFYEKFAGYSYVDYTYLICNKEFFITLAQMNDIIANNQNYMQDLVEGEITPRMLANRYRSLCWDLKRFPIYDICSY